VRVAREAGARKLVLFHHDPAHEDRQLDAIECATQEFSARLGGPPVIAAYEGLEIELPAIRPAGV
jgi:ribonuclease BN (tRNA processing enzyme)